jgi:MFS family permease
VSTTEPDLALPRRGLYYGWVNLVLAAIAMTATLPGRTHGLGLITRPLTDDPSLGVDESWFSVLNFWAILIGSAFCLPIGWLIDRLGVRVVLTGVALGLGASVLWMSSLTGVVALFVALTLIRGLGQGALSVVSMAMIGKWFRRRLGMAMGIFSVLLAIGFIASTVGVGEAAKVYGWRPAWAGVSLALLFGLVPLGWLLTRDSPESIGQAPDESAIESTTEAPLNLPLSAALRSPAFWAFTLAASLFNLVWSAITLFNQSILDAQGLGDTFIPVMAILVFTGLPANLMAGWLAGRWPMGRVLLIGMVVLAAALVAFPSVHTREQVYLYAAALGVSGGVITVVYFAVYGHAFGRAHLGTIQATVQVVSVFASALGPVLLTSCRDMTGSYSLLFHAAAVAAAGLGLFAWLAPLPRPESVQGIDDSATDPWTNPGHEESAIKPNDNGVSPARETVIEMPSPERSH